MDIFSCNGSLYTGGLTGNREKSAEFDYLKTSRSVVCNLTTNSVRSNTISTGNISASALITGDIILEPKDAIDPPFNNDCSYGKIYAVNMLTTPPAMGPYDNIAPVFQDCLSSHILGNVASDSVNAFSTPGAIILSNGSPNGHIVKESKIVIDGNTLSSVENDFLDLRSVENILITTRSFDVYCQEFSVGGSSIFLNSEFDDYDTELSGGIVVKSIQSNNDALGLSTVGFPSQSEICVCGDPTLNYSYGDFIIVENSEDQINTGLYQIMSISYNSLTNIGTIFINTGYPGLSHFVKTILRQYSYGGNENEPCEIKLPVGYVRKVTVSYFGTDAATPGQFVFKRGDNAFTMTTSMTNLSVIQPASADVQITPITNGYSIGIGRPLNTIESTIIIAGQSSYGLNLSNTETTILGAGNELELLTLQGTTSIGYNAGRTPLGVYTTSIGVNAGNNGQGDYSTAIGYNAGISSQGPLSVAIGSNAACNFQGPGALAIGAQAGYSQNEGAIAIGFTSATDSLTSPSPQPSQSIAIGYNCQVPTEEAVIAFGGTLKMPYTNIITPENSSNTVAIPTNAAGFMHLEYNGARYCIPLFHAPS